MIVRHLHKVNELLTVLDQPAVKMQALRGLLTVDKPLSLAPDVGVI